MFILTFEVSGTLKVIQALPKMPKPVTETEINNLLQSKWSILEMGRRLLLKLPKFFSAWDFGKAE